MDLKYNREKLSVHGLDGRYVMGRSFPSHVVLPLMIAGCDLRMAVSCSPKMCRRAPLMTPYASRTAKLLVVNAHRIAAISAASD